VIVYLDTSALLKPIFTSEPGGQVVADAWSVADGVVTSRLAYPEARAALAAAGRARRFSSDDLDRGRAYVDRVFGELEIVELTAGIALVAGDLADRFPLRGADAVHLGSAIAALSGEDGVLLTWDVRLRDAASAVGLSAAPGFG
jgi:uncharacterized protein